MRLAGDDTLHTACIFSFVALGACCLDGWPTTVIECLFLKRGDISVKSHFSAKGVKFKNKMALGKSAN